MLASPARKISINAGAVHPGVSDRILQEEARLYQKVFHSRLRPAGAVIGNDLYLDEEWDGRKEVPTWLLSMSQIWYVAL